MTVAYLKETAEQAGLATDWISMEEIGWDRLSGRFVDNKLRFIRSLFKLYPWEWLTTGRAASGQQPRRQHQTRQRGHRVPGWQDAPCAEPSECLLLAVLHPHVPESPIAELLRPARKDDACSVLVVPRGRLIESAS
ncbi:hypothetical protein STENM327S_03897 [Streptomyces tendae]